MVYPALLPLMRTSRLRSSRLNRTPLANLNGLVRFARKTKSGFCACAIAFQTLKDQIWFLRMCHRVSNVERPNLVSAQVPSRFKRWKTKSGFCACAIAFQTWCTKLYLEFLANEGISIRLFHLADANKPGTGLCGRNSSSKAKVVEFSLVLLHVHIDVWVWAFASYVVFSIFVIIIIIIIIIIIFIYRNWVVTRWQWLFYM
jgi:hypothetical protein